MKSISILAIFICLVIRAGHSKTIQNSEDIIYFPSSDGDGKLIPAKLRPITEDDKNKRVGDVKDIHFYLYTR
jgi:hypothetical protein